MTSARSSIRCGAFEDSETNDARFAAMLDRLQPIMLNYTKGGRSWQEHGIHKEQVLARNLPYLSESEQLADVIRSVIDDAAEKGWLK